MAGFDAVNEDAQTRALVVAVSCAVGEDCHGPAVIEHTVEAQVIPSGRDQRMHFKCVVGAWTQARKPRDDQVAVTGMIDRWTMTATITVYAERQNNRTP